MKIHESEIKKLEKSIKDAALEFEISKAKLEALKKTLNDFKMVNQND